MTELPRLPFDNPAMLGIAPQMRALQQEGPITRVRTAGGAAGPAGAALPEVVQWVFAQVESVAAGG